MSPDTKVIVLPNKLRVALTEVPARSSILIQVYVKTGFAHEYVDTRTYGYAHFLEHMLFKGTKRRSQKELNTEADNLGGNFNAYTSREHTSYHIQVHSSHTERGLDLISDMLFNSTINDKELKKEKSVIIEEIKSWKDNPETELFTLFEGYHFGNADGVGGLGTEENINNADRKALLRFYESHYNPENMVVTLTGNLSKINKDLLLKYFGKQKNKYPSSKVPFSTIAKDKLKNKFLQRDIEQVHFYMVYPWVKAMDPAEEITDIFDEILAEGMSSRLFQRLREDKGLCYSIYTQEGKLEREGYYAVSCSCSPDKVIDAIKIIDKEIKEVSLGKVSKKELKNAKERYAINQEMSMESLGRISSYVGNALLYGSAIPDLHKSISIANSVTERDIKSFISENIWKNQRPVLYMLGNFPQEIVVKKTGIEKIIHQEK